MATSLKRKFFLLSFCLISIHLIGQHSDFVSALDLCDTRVFTFSKLNGKGADEEIINNCFPRDAKDIEQNSIWLKFKTNSDALLSFAITPLKAEDDLDFILYRFDKELKSLEILRCNAGGPNLGNKEPTVKNCTGTIGLRSSERDSIETYGCSQEKNQFLKSVVTSEFDTYYLFINNNSSNSGFTLQFDHSIQILPSETKQEECLQITKSFGSDNIVKINVKSKNSVVQQVNLKIFDKDSLLQYDNTSELLYMFNIVGKYKIVAEIINEFGCSEIYTKYVDISKLSTKTNKNVSFGELFPQPSSQFVHLPYSAKKDLEVDWKLVSIDGKIVKEQAKIQCQKGVNILTIDISGIIPGYFFMVMNLNNELILSKPVIIK